MAGGIENGRRPRNDACDKIYPGDVVHLPNGEVVVRGGDTVWGISQTRGYYNHVQICGADENRILRGIREGATSHPPMTQSILARGEAQNVNTNSFTMSSGEKKTFVLPQNERRIDITVNAPEGRTLGKINVTIPEDAGLAIFASGLRQNETYSKNGSVLVTTKTIEPSKSTTSYSFSVEYILNGNGVMNNTDIVVESSETPIASAE